MAWTSKIIKAQRKLCREYNLSFVECIPALKLGVNDSIKSGVWPIHGLRHPTTNTTNGWYLWAGGEIDQADDDFFQPIHAEHLSEWAPFILPYLGLPPGYRFLLGEKNYVDIWFDEHLLDV